MTIQIKIKSVYGNQLIYPANDTAEKFTTLLGKKTFTQTELEIIKSLGFHIEQVNAYPIGGL